MDNEKLALLLLDFGVDIRKNGNLELLLNVTKKRSKTLVELAENIKTIINPPEEYDKKMFKKVFKGDAKEILSKFIGNLYKG